MDYLKLKQKLEEECIDRNLIDFEMANITQNNIYSMIPKSLYDDKVFMLDVIQNFQSECFYLCSDRLKSDKDFVYKSLKSLGFIDKDYTSYKIVEEMYIETLKKGNISIKDIIPKKLLNNVELKKYYDNFKAVFKNNMMNCREVKILLKYNPCDKELIKYYLKNIDDYDISIIPDKLCDDKEFMLDLIINYQPESYFRCSEKLKMNMEIVFNAFKGLGYITNEKYENIEDMYSEAIKYLNGNLEIPKQLLKLSDKVAKLYKEYEKRNNISG